MSFTRASNIFFYTPPLPHPALDQKKEMTTSSVLLRKVKYGQYYKMTQRLTEKGNLKITDFRISRVN